MLGTELTALKRLSAGLVHPAEAVRLIIKEILRGEDEVDSLPETVVKSLTGNLLKAKRLRVTDAAEAAARLLLILGVRAAKENAAVLL
mgnify:CR=1 FL=1